MSSKIILPVNRCGIVSRDFVSVHTNTIKTLATGVFYAAGETVGRNSLYFKTSPPT